jgi:hypothetical protein
MEIRLESNDNYYDLGDSILLHASASDEEEPSLLDEVVHAAAVDVYFASITVAPKAVQTVMEVDDTEAEFYIQDGQLCYNVRGQKPDPVDYIRRLILAALKDADLWYYHRRLTRKKGEWQIFYTLDI